MHEHSFIDAILLNIEDKEKVKEILLEVGELAGIEAEHLKEHLKERVDWKIDVVEKKARVRCDCGYEGEAKIRERLHDMVVFECPVCGDIPKVLEGKDIKILKIIYS